MTLNVVKITLGENISYDFLDEKDLSIIRAYIKTDIPGYEKDYTLKIDTNTKDSVGVFLIRKKDQTGKTLLLVGLVIILAILTVAIPYFLGVFVAFIVAAVRKRMSWKVLYSWFYFIEYIRNEG